MGPRAGLDGRKMSSPPGFDPGPSSPQSVTMPTELPGPQVPHPRITNITCHRTKSSLHGDLAPGICASLRYCI